MAVGAPVPSGDNGESIVQVESDDLFGLIAALTESHWQPTQAKFRPAVAYRGHTSAARNLPTGLARIAFTLEEFDRFTDTDGQSVPLFFEPPSLDERIVNQAAIFSTMSGSASRLDEWLGRHPGMYRKVIIPAKLKWRIRDHLDQANVNERVLFPGLDGLSLWLRRYYGPRESG